VNYKSRDNSPIKRGVTYTLNTETLDENFNKLLDLGRVSRTNTETVEGGGGMFRKNNRTKTVKHDDVVPRVCHIPRSANHTPLIRSRNNSQSRKNIEISSDTIEDDFHKK
jgi:hypothetical protein